MCSSAVHAHDGPATTLRPGPRRVRSVFSALILPHCTAIHSNSAHMRAWLMHSLQTSISLLSGPGLGARHNAVVPWHGAATLDLRCACAHRACVRVHATHAHRFAPGEMPPGVVPLPPGVVPMPYGMVPGMPPDGHPPLARPVPMRCPGSPSLVPAGPRTCKHAADGLAWGLALRSAPAEACYI